MENNMKTSITFSIDVSVAQRFKEKAKAESINKSQLVERLLTNWISGYDKDK